MPRVVVVGAGISGLSVAYRLQQLVPDAEVTVLEEASRPGGTTWTLREDGFQLEVGPNGFLDSKPTTRALCEDAGLTDRLVTASQAAAHNRYILFRGRLRALPAGPPGLLRTDLLSGVGRLSLFWELFRRPLRESREESIDAFVRRRAGREAAEVLADAMVTGIYAGDPKLLSVSACFPRLAQLERDFGSVIRGFAKTARRGGSKLWSLRGGLREMIEAVAARLKRPPVFGVGVRNVRRRPDGEGFRWEIRAEGRDRWDADAVVLTCPAYRQAEVLAEVDAELADRIAEIAYNRVVVVGLGYRRADVASAPDGFGFIAPQRTRRDLLGVQWCSSIYPGRSPEGTVLWRAICGGWHRPDIVDWDDERLLGAVRAELERILKVHASPVFHRIVRWPRAIPQYHLGHLDRLAWIEAHRQQHPGLFLGGNAYRGVALNDCTEQGELVARAVGEFLQGIRRQFPFPPHPPPDTMAADSVSST
jgi:oxygen-dependent protoporphyrinogen oxidase